MNWNIKNFKSSLSKENESKASTVCQMEFCPKCGTRLKPIKKKSKKTAAIMLACPKCKYEKPVSGEIPAPAKILETANKEGIAIIGKEEQKLRTLPTVKIECPKCGNNVAYVWQVQTRGSDESSTQFFRCTKCNYTFREYS